VIALVLFLLAAGLDRLLISESWPLLDGPRRRWREWRPRVLGYLRSAPGTYIYLFVLLITSWVLQTSSGRIANALLLERSTNLHQLARDPVRVLFSSAFWVGGFGSWLEWFVLLSLFVAPVERWIGTARTALVFVIGHVGATLVTAAGLSIALRSDLVESSVVDARDVGASYGFAAVVALLVYRFPLAPRLSFAAILLAGAGGQVALDHNFTNWGHIIALGLGFACYPLTTRRRRPRQRPLHARGV
jgi:membrane associated rhomboid family serine protease